MIATPVEGPPIRESGIAALLGWAFTIWCLLFALNTMLVADHLTSPQWVSLMTVPGGKWFWTGLFGGTAAILAIGLWMPLGYRTRAIGFGLIPAGCGGIAMFYLIAPLFHLGPITLGYWPWFVPAGFGVLGAIVNWWPIPWF